MSALAFVLQQVPVCALAAILVYAGLKLVDWKSFARIREYGRMPVLIYLSTVVGIVVADLLTGVLIGIALSVANLLYKVTHSTLNCTWSRRVPGVSCTSKGCLLLRVAETLRHARPHTPRH